MGVLQPDITDVLIVGAGPAGLSCAAVLSRLLWKTVIFDSGVYRYRKSKNYHMVPAYDHQSLLSYIGDARSDLLDRYDSNTFVNATAENIQKVADGENEGLFKITDSQDRSWLGRKVVLAFGNVEKFPAITGYEECWIKGIFHCQVHRGYEVAGCDMAGVLAVEGDASIFKAQHLALEAKSLAKQVTIFTHGNDDLAAKVGAALSRWPQGLYTIDTRAIKQLIKGRSRSDVIIEFEDGEKTIVNYIVHRPIPELPGQLHQDLALEIDNSGIINPGFIKVSGLFNETSVPGIFAVGDCASAFKVVVSGVNMGAFCAAGISAQLASESPSIHGFSCSS